VAGGDQTVKRNMERFPQDFMFRFTEEEWDALAQSGMISQIV
jgi:ORF6N domain.